MPRAQQNRISRARRKSPTRTPMTIPAIAPPLRPPEWLDSLPVRVIFAPVATGAIYGTVVVGELVAVTTTPELLVGRTAAEADSVLE